ncbi:MAG: CbiX/SirB N-terminal domain-containing protein, partial [Gammaproteobacteria bacterium]|nr:CbiX/SirB N-terminal domain-containing protein [Gammaproteobacteria bacterium]
MKALLLIAHGSRREASNDEVRQLVKKLKTQVGTEYPIMEAAFLEIAQPLIDGGLDCCANQGATEIYVVPYFL